MVVEEEISLPLGTAIGAIGNVKQLSIIISIILYSQIILLFISYKLGYPPEMLRIIQIVGATLITIYKIFYCYKKCEMPLLKYSIDVLLRSFFTISLTTTLVFFIHLTMPTSFIRLIVVFIFCLAILDCIHWKIFWTHNDDLVYYAGRTWYSTFF